MKAARLLSGDIALSRATDFSATHSLPSRLHFQRFPAALNETDCWSSENSITVNGNRCESKAVPAAVESVAASLVWSKAGVWAPLAAASTTTNWLPPPVVSRYQNRS